MNSFLETLKQLGPARLAIMGSVLLGLMLFFIFVSLHAFRMKKEEVDEFSNLPLDDSIDRTEQNQSFNPSVIQLLCTS